MARAWTPSDLDGAPKGYWDASDASSLTLSGSNVTAWANKGVGATSAVQSDGGSQPIYSATARNGTPGLTFDGNKTLGFTGTGFPQGSAPLYIMVVAYQSGTTNPGYYQGAFSYGTPYSSAEIYNAGQNVDFWSSASSRITSNVVWYGKDRIVEVTDDGTNAVSYADATQADSGGVGLSTSGTTGTIGSGTTYNGDRWVGAIQAIIVLDYIPTLSDQQKLQGWASWTFGLNGANLPTGHPFKTFAPTFIYSKRDWLPSDDTGTILFWGDARQGITKDASGNITGVATRGGLIPSLHGTTGATISTAGLNGQDAFAFSAASALQATLSTAIAAGTPVNVFFVGGASASDGGYGRAASLLEAANGSDVYSGLSLFSSLNKNDGTFRAYHVFNGPATSKGVTFGTNHIFAGYTLDGTTANADADGQHLGNASYAPTEENAKSLNTFLFGSGNDGPWTGLIGEMIVVLGTMTQARVDRYRGYLANGWKLRTNLAATDQYRGHGPKIATSGWRATLGNALIAEYDISSGYAADNVATLVDTSGNENHLVLSGSGSAIWATSSQNGKPGITVDSSSYFSSPTVSSFAIGSTAGPNPAAAIGMVFTKTTSVQYARFASYVGVNAGSSNDYSVIGNAIFAYDDGNGKIGVANASLGNNDAPISLNTPHIMVSQFTGAQSEVYIGSAAAVTNPYTSTNFSSPGRMAIMGGGGSQEGGIFSAAIVVSRALTASERAGYLAEMQSTWIGSATTTPTAPSIYKGAKSATAIYIGAMAPSAIYKGAQSFV